MNNKIIFNLRVEGIAERLALRLLDANANLIPDLLTVEEIPSGNGTYVSTMEGIPGNYAGQLLYQTSNLSREVIQEVEQLFWDGIAFARNSIEPVDKKIIFNLRVEGIAERLALRLLDANANLIPDLLTVEEIPSANGTYASTMEGIPGNYAGQLLYERSNLSREVIQEVEQFYWDGFTFNQENHEPLGLAKTAQAILDHLQADYFKGENRYQRFHKTTGEIIYDKDVFLSETGFHITEHET